MEPASTHWLSSTLHFPDVSGNAGADGVEMDVDLRVVGGFEAGKIMPEENAENDQNDEGRANDQPLVRALPG